MEVQLDMHMPVPLLFHTFCDSCRWLAGSSPVEAEKRGFCLSSSCVLSIDQQVAQWSQSSVRPSQMLVPADSTGIILLDLAGWFLPCKTSC